MSKDRTGQSRCMASRRLAAASSTTATPPVSDERAAATEPATLDQGGGDPAASLWRGLCRLLVAGCEAAAQAASSRSGGPERAHAEKQQQPPSQQQQQLSRREHRWLSASVEKPSWCDLCGGFVWGRCNTCYHCLDCKYTCHTGCKQLVVQGSCTPLAAGSARAGDCGRALCLPDAKMVRGDSSQDVDDTDSGYSGSGQCSLQAAAQSSSSSLSWGSDAIGCGMAVASYTRDELCKRIQQYNLKCGFAQFMTLPNKDNVFQGYVQVCLSISRPVQMSLSTRPPSLRDALRGPNGRPSSMEGPLSTTAVRLPKNAVVSLHVSSMDTVTIVIEMLLKKFKIMDNPHRFTLYEQTVSSDADVRLRRMDRAERPLVNYLTWRTDSYAQIPAASLTGPPNADVSIKRLVLQEDNSGEIVWEAFSIPELLNFLRILEREEKEQADQIKAKYLARKKMLEVRLSKERPLQQAAAVPSPTAASAAVTRRQKKR